MTAPMPTQDSGVLPDGWGLNANGDGGATRRFPDGHVTVWPCPGQSVAVSAAAADVIACHLHAVQVAALRAGDAA
jgi:hypothetical protein